MPMSVSSDAAMPSASADDDKVGHVDYRLVAQGGVDLVRGRVRLVGEQAGRAPSAWIFRETSATALLAQPRPHCAGGVYTGATRTTPNEGGLTPVRCTRSPVSPTQNHS